MNIIDRHGSSNFIKIANNKLGFYDQRELRDDYLESLEIYYPIIQIYFSKSI